MAAIFDFQLEQFQLFLTYNSPLYFQPSLESTELSVHEKIYKTVFQDSRHFVFPIRTILAKFDLQAASILNPIKFRVNWPFSSREEDQIGFQDGGYLVFSDRNDFSYFFI